MNGLADFLLARYEAEERLLREQESLTGPDRVTARGLAECEAKRQIVALAVAYLLPPESGGWDDVGSREWHNAEQILHLLALPYADYDKSSGRSQS